MEITGSWTYAPVDVQKWNVTYTWTGLPTETLYDADGNVVDPEEPANVTGITNGDTHTVDTTYTNATVYYTHDGFGNVNGTYTFSGWDKSGTLTVTSNVEITGSWTYAPVEVKKWTVTYTDGVADEEVFADQTTPDITNNAETPAFDGTPERAGYAFNEWSPEVAEKVTKDVTYTAQWTAINYKLIYDANGGENAPVDDKNYHITQTATLSTDGPTHADVDGKNVVFIGWTEEKDPTIYTKDDNKPAVRSEVTFKTSDITVYAVWGYDEDGDDIPDVTEDKITISAGDVTRTYNGLLQEVTDYKADGLLEGHKIAALTYSAEGTDASEIAYNGAFGDDLEIVDANGADVTDTYFVTYVPGTLTINQLPITIQARSDSKTYDGKALTNSGSDVTKGNLVNGHAYTATVKGTITYCGSVENVPSDAMILDANQNDVTKNYAIAYLNGTLTVTDGTGEGETPIDNQVVQKDHGDPNRVYALGETVTFTITVTNVYDEPKTITLTEREGMTLNQSVFQNVATGASVTATVTYTVTEADVLAGVIHNQVTAAFDGGGSFIGEDDVPVQVPAPSLLVQKTVTSNAVTYGIGETVTYNIRVTNNGNVTLTNVEVTDPLTNQRWPVASMAPGDVQEFNTSYVVTAADVEVGSVTNTATATGTSPEGHPNPTGTDSRTVDTVDAIRTMEIEKTRNTPTPEWGYFMVGQTIEYTIAVTNTGNVNLYNVVVTDDLTGMSETIPTLAPGATQTFTTHYVVRGANAGTVGVVNTASATAPGGPTVTDTTDPAPVVGAYTLTVYYVFADGTEAAPTVSMRLYGGQWYRVNSPAVPGFIANTGFITGFMPQNDVTWTIVYNAPAAPPAPVVVDTPDDTIETDPNPTGGLELDPNDYTLIPIEPEETPLENLGLDGHVDCALHFILILAAMLVMMAYTSSMKKHQKKIQELTEELELEKKHRGANDGSGENE